MADETIDQEEVIRRLRMAIDDFGSAKDWASRKGISPAYVNDVLHRRRAPGSKILAAIGIESMVVYRQTLCLRCGRGQMEEGYLVCARCVDLPKGFPT